MEYVIEPTKTNAGTRVIPMTKEVTEMFRAIIQDRPEYKVEKVVGGYTGFLFLDKNGMPLVAMHWEHRFNSMVGRYNEIYKVQMPNITPHGRVIIRTSEYSCVMKSHFRKFGNQMSGSGNHLCNYASLLA